MNSTESARRWIRIAFGCAALALAVNAILAVREHSGALEALLHLASPGGLLCLTSAMLFTKPRSQSFYALIFASLAFSIVVFGGLGHRLLGH
jgi:hypothetical protein